MFSVRVESFEEWRQSARTLLIRRIEPNAIQWEHDHQAGLDFETKEIEDQKIHPDVIKIPRQFIPLAEAASCYRCPSRWALLYSIAWRLVFENRQLLELGIDPQIHTLNSMCKSVWRDRHKMEAFVRFRRVDTAHYQAFRDSTSGLIGDPPEYFVAWFEPEHLILPISIDFFIKRFTNMSWSILTPDGCAHWDQKTLSLTEGVSRNRQSEDSVEALWLTYYSHIFNPARLKLKAMQSEMPKKYWVNLPEAPLIDELARNAGHRVDTMLQNMRSDTAQNALKSKAIKAFQAQQRQSS